METLDAVKSGWTYASQLAGADAAAHYGDLYIGRVEEAIKQLEDNINRHNYRNLGVGQFKGYVAEEWAAGSFNVDAVIFLLTLKSINVLILLIKVYISLFS